MKAYFQILHSHIAIRPEIAPSVPLFFPDFEPKEIYLTEVKDDQDIFRLALNFINVALKRPQKGLFRYYTGNNIEEY